MKIFTHIKVVQSLTKSRMLTCEGEIIAYLIENGPSRPRDIVKNSSHSQVSVFNKLKEMSEAGILEKDAVPSIKSANYAINQSIMSRIFDAELVNGADMKFMLFDLRSDIAGLTL
jgi:hypothetical protein